MNEPCYDGCVTRGNPRFSLKPLYVMPAFAVSFPYTACMEASDGIPSISRTEPKWERRTCRPETDSGQS